MPPIPDLTSWPCGGTTARSGRSSRHPHFWWRWSATGEIYISRHGIYREPGGYIALDLGSNSIRYESAALVDRPTPHVHIEVSVNMDPGGGGWVRRTLTDVGVPPGHEDEARTLVDLLRAHVLNGSREARGMDHTWEPREPLDGGAA